MIIVTGANGFIGSALVSKLNQENYKDIVVVDDFSSLDKFKNLERKIFSHKIERDKFLNWLVSNHKLVQFIFHIGARTDTTEKDEQIFNKLNLEYSKDVWSVCVKYGIPLIYASSAATYGNGEKGYADDHDLVPQLKPLNPYGISKNEFDKWALMQSEKPYYWIGLKFFNVYGPNEYHKGRMASVVFHAYNQIKETGKMKLFRSHRPDFKDGEQKRDFIYVKDVVEVLHYLMENRKKENNGIYNLGTGKADTFLELANSVFYALHQQPDIEFIDTPMDIRENYQYYTQAEMAKLRSIGYTKSFMPLKEGIFDYVKNYLEKGEYY